MGAAAFFGTLAQRAREKAEGNRKEWEANRQSEIRLYQNALENALANGDIPAAKIAGDNLTKLYNVKGKTESPFAKIIDFAGKVHGAKHPSGAPEGVSSPPQAQGATQPSPTPSGAPTAPPAPQRTGILPRIGQGMEGVGRGAAGVAGGVLNKLSGNQNLPQLPPIDSAAFSPADPLRDAKRQEQTLAYRIEEAQKAEGVTPDSERGKEISRLLRGLSKPGAGPRNIGTNIPGASLAGKVASDAFGNAIDPKGVYREQVVGDQSQYIPVAATPHEQKPIRAFSKDAKGFYSVMLDPRTNQAIPGTENRDILPPASYLEHIRQGNYFYTDEDGNIHKVAATSSSQVALPGGPKATPSDSGSPKKTLPVIGGTKAGGGSRDTIIGHKQSSADTAVQRDAIKASDRLRPLAGLLDTQEDYLKNGKYTPRQDLALIVAAVRAMNPGSIRLPQKELELELKAGSYGDRLRRSYEVATTGLLPDDQRQDLFRIVQSELTHAGSLAAQDWQQAFEGKKELPAHLKRFAAPSGGGGASGKAVSLAEAKKLPRNKGKSDAEVRADIELHGHTVIP